MRFVALLLALLGIVAVSPATGSVHLELSGGTGDAAIRDQGTLRGSVRKGKIVISRLTYGARPAAGSYVRGCEYKSGRLSTRLVCRGRRVRFYLHGGRWVVRLHGVGINVRGLATGELALKNGTAGTYWVEGRRRRPWPADQQIIAVPTSAEGAWKTVLDDKFESGGVPGHWGLYNGPYSSSGNCATPSHASVANGYLRMLMRHKPTGKCGAGWYSTGMQLLNRRPYVSVDQRITLRWRVLYSGVVSHRIIPMRWPVDGSSWPAGGEEDYCEGRSNTRCSTFLHYSSRNLHLYHHYGVDLTQWHTMRFERRRYVVTAYIDDLVTPVWTYVGSPKTLPATKKVAVLQQECRPPRDGGCPSGTVGSEEIQIDWIKVENPS